MSIKANPTAIGAFSNRSHNVDALYDHMTRDKKARAGRLTFILARGIGGKGVARAVICRDGRRHAGADSQR